MAIDPKNPDINLGGIQQSPAPVAGAPVIPPMQSVAPITSKSFSAANPSIPTAYSNPSSVPQSAPTGAAPVQPDVTVQPDKSISFEGSPLSPTAKVSEDARILSSLANNYRKAGQFAFQGKQDEAAKHLSYAEELKQSLGSDNEHLQTAMVDLGAREKAMNAAIAKGKALNVDPDAYWNRKGTASNILSAISVGLGSFGSGMTHGATGNPALTMVNNAIEHDIDSQKSNIANYWNAVKQQQGLDDNALGKEIFYQNAHSALRLSGYKVYESQLQGLKANTDSQLSKLGFDKLIDEAQQAITAERGQLYLTIAAQKAAAAAGRANELKRLRDKQDKLGERALDLLKSGAVSTLEEGEKQVYSGADARELKAVGLGPDWLLKAGSDIDKTEAGANKVIADKKQELDLQAEKLAAQAYDQYGPGKEFEDTKKSLEQDAAKQLNEFSKTTRAQQKSESEQIVAGTRPGAISSKDKEGRTVSVNGKSYLAPTVEDAQKFRVGAAALIDAQKTIEEIRKARAGNEDWMGKGGSLSPTKTKIGEQLQQKVIAKLAAANATGVLSDTEFERYKRVVPNYNDYQGLFSTEDDFNKILDGLSKNFSDSLDSNAVAHLGGSINTTPPAPAAKPGSVKIDFTPKK